MCALASMGTTLSIVAEIVGKLLTGRTGDVPVSLDEIAEAIGAAPVTMPEIEAIFDALEAAGHPVSAEPRNPPAALARD